MKVFTIMGSPFIKGKERGHRSQKYTAEGLVRSLSLNWRPAG
jgi:hypothetical protein